MSILKWEKKFYIDGKITRAGKDREESLELINQMILIRHGGIMYRCHPCHLMKFRENHVEGKDLEKKVSDIGRCGDKKDKKLHIEHGENEVPASEREIEEEVVDAEQAAGREIEEEVVDADVLEQQTEHTEEAQLNEGEDIVIYDNSVKPSRNELVKYRLGPEDEWREVKVMSFQPKQTGTYQNWINVQNPREQYCVNWNDVSSWMKVPDHGQVMLVTKANELSQEVIDAKQKEIQNMKDNDVYEEVPYTGQRTVSSRWVLTEKFKDGEKKVKARLVARGFEEADIELIVESPTCTKESVRLVMVTAASKLWKLQAIDITAAFLQGDEIDRQVYLRLPNDVRDKSTVWRLKRTIYGLKDAPRSWYEKVRSVMLELGATISKYDQALFLWHDSCRELKGILACHVDDFSLCGDQWFQCNVVQKVKLRFKVGAHSAGTFKYLGLTVYQSNTGVSISQDSYIPNIEPVIVSKERSVHRNEELLAEEKYDLKSLGGQLLWAATQTRPDCSYEACIVSNIGKNPTIKSIHQANKAVSKLKSKRVEIKFPKLVLKKLTVVCFADATHASLPDGGSQAGQLVFVQDPLGTVAPIHWQSKRLNRVTKSPLSSEIMAACEALDAGYLIASMLRELFALSDLPEIICFTDSASLCDVLKTSTVISDKRMRVEISRLKEMIRLKEAKLKWIPGHQQLADSLTKPGVSTQRLLDTLEKGYINFH